MSKPNEAIEMLVNQMSGKGGLPRDEARMIAETANHASDEAIKTMARICTALGDPQQVAIALYLGAQMVEVRAKAEGNAVRSFVVDAALHGTTAALNRL